MESTPFDNLINNRFIQILKTAICFVPHESKCSFALMIKVMELLETEKLLSKPEPLLSLHMCESNDSQDHVLEFLSAIRPFCMPSELEQIDQLLNTLSMFELYSTMFQNQEENEP